MIWLAGCTLTTGSSASSAQPTVNLTIPPRMTLTVFDPVQPEPTQTWRPAARTAVRPTAPPSPTPQTYTVQADDTLLDIAIQFDVAFESLVTANPEIDPELLQIGQRLRIPSPPADSTDTIATLPAPSSTLPTPTCYPATPSGIICLGYVPNNNGQPLEQVAVEVQLFGEGDLPFATGQAAIEQALIPPGALAPYRATFPDVALDRVQGVSVLMVAGTVALSGDHFATLTLENERLLNVERGYVYTADVVNTGEVAAMSPRVVVTLMDENEQVYGYRVWQADGPLPSLGRTSVRISLVPVLQDGLPPLSFRAHAEARRARPSAS